MSFWGDAWHSVKDVFSGEDSSSGSSGSNAEAALAAATTNGLFNIASSVLSNYFSKKEAKRAYERNLDMWNMENDYNHPVNQMIRLRMAGLNPNMVYDNGATTLAASTKSAPVASRSFPQLDLLGAVNAYQDIEQKDATTENIKAQAMKSMADALVAIKDYDTYSKTGAHPNRSVSQQATNIILDGLMHYSKPVTNWLGDQITATDKYINSRIKKGNFKGETIDWRLQ